MGPRDGSMSAGGPSGQSSGGTAESHARAMSASLEKWKPIDFNATPSETAELVLVEAEVAQSQAPRGSSRPEPETIWATVVDGVEDSARIEDEAAREQFINDLTDQLAFELGLEDAERSRLGVDLKTLAVTAKVLGAPFVIGYIGIQVAAFISAEAMNDPEGINVFDASKQVLGVLGKVASIVTAVYLLFNKLRSRDESKPSLTRDQLRACLLYTSPSPRDQRGSRMPSSA